MCIRDRSGHVVDVGAGILGRLGHREGIAGVLTPVGQEHEAIRLPGGRTGEGELERLRQVRAPASDLRLRAVDLAGGPEWLVHHRLLLSLIHISEPTRLLSISYADFCL